VELVSLLAEGMNLLRSSCLVERKLHKK